MRAHASDHLQARLLLEFRLTRSLAEAWSRTARFALRGNGKQTLVETVPIELPTPPDLEVV